MASITTADVRAYVAERQKATTITRGAYEIKKKDGTIVTVKEQERTITGVSNGEINRELTILKRIFTLAVQCRKAATPAAYSAAPRGQHADGFFGARAVHQRSGAPARSAAACDRVRLHHRLADRQRSAATGVAQRRPKGGEVRLDSGTTKNREGRVFPLTDELRALLEERRGVTREAEKKAERIIPWVFFRMVAENAAVRSTRSRFARSRRRGKPPASLPAALAASRTTCDGRQSATWCAAACRSVSR